MKKDIRRVILGRARRGPSGMVSSRQRCNTSKKVEHGLPKLERRRKPLQCSSLHDASTVNAGTLRQIWRTR